MKKRSLLLRALEKRMMLDASLPAIAGQVLWLDADDTSTVLDAEGDNAASGGAFSGSVQTWQDKSTSGFHVTAAAVGNRPTYTTNIAGLNNNNALTFDGGSDWLRNTGAVVAGDDYTMFVVFNKTSANATRDAIFEMGGGGSRNGIFVSDPSAVGKINMYHNGTFYNPSSTYTASAYTMFTSTVNTNAYTLTQNGASVGTGTAGSNRVATTGIFVGNDSSSGDELQGNIAEIIVYDRDLTADERHDVETYLAGKWGLTITNATPTVSTNTGATLNEGATTTITAAMLASTDTDNTESTLIYTVTNVTDNGTLFRDADSDNVIDAGEELTLNETFTQADITAGFLRYTHNSSDTLSDAFSFTVTDQKAVSTNATFNFTINPVLDLPVTSGAVLWLDGNDAATILDADGDAANSGSFNNGVQTWVNKVSPGTNNAVQTTLADRPDYTASGINNLGSVAFDGPNSEFFNLGSFSALTAGDIFVVLRATQDQPGSPQNTGFMGFGTNPNNTHYAWTDGFVYDDFGSTTRYNIGNLPTNLTQAHTYNVSSEAGSWIARQNGNVRYTSGSNTVSFTTTARLGSSDSAAYTFNGQIAEVIMFNRVLGAAERTAVESYLNGKWLGNTAPTLAAAGPFAFNENIAGGTPVTTMVGSDVDGGQTLTYSIQSGNTGGMFAIDANTGAITFAGSPNYEALNSYNLVVRVTDNGTGNLFAERTVTININDINENPTIATNTGATVVEGSNVIITSAMLNEGDPDDSGAGLTYTASSLTNGTITVGGATQTTFTQADINAGIVRFVHNGGEAPTASFAISLADGGENGSTPATGTFNLTVTAVNDAPAIATNTGAAVNEGSFVVITNAMLNEGDVDDSGAGLTYTASSLTNGTITVGGVTQTTFTQADIDAGIVRFNHDGSETVAASFAFSLADGGENGATPATGTFNLSVTAVNDSPIIALNTGATLAEGGTLVITSAMLNEGDPDDAGAGVTYTASNLVNGVIEVNNVVQNTFTQADINAGLVEFVHNGGENLLAGFDISLADGGENGATPATGTFSITVTPVNDAPVIDGWSLVSSENFEAGATGWANNTTTVGGTYFTRYLGPFSNDGGVQSNSKTYTLSGGQEYTVIEFDFYRMDSWDNEFFRIWVNDTQVYNQAFNTGIVTIPDGSSGIASWTVSELTTISGNAGNAAGFNDQIFRFTMTIQNAGAGSVKIGFGSTTNQANNDESWGIDNVKVFEADDGGTPGPFTLAENTANGQVVGRITAGDIEGDAIAYSITGGTGAAHFAINPTTGAITVTNSAALNYESVTSFTLQITATDNGSPNLSDVETITINLVDVPENTAPVITTTGPFNVAENAANNSVVANMAATDAEGNSVTWAITGGNTDNIFSITAGGQVRVNSNTNLNYEWDNQYVLTITATDNGFGALVGTRNITINITDINEAPTFDTHTALLAANPYLRYNATTGNYYQYVSTAATYAAAGTAAAAATLHGVGGHIATITSGAENTYVRGLAGTAQIWLAGRDSAVEGVWRWDAGGTESGVQFWQGGGSGAGGSLQNSLYANWNGPTQPDNNGGNEDNLVMLNTGFWNDVNGGSNAYVIEWEGAAVQAALAALQNGPYTINENSAPGTSAGFLEGFDIDAGDTKTYSKTGGTGAALFDVNAATGEITLATGASLNYESASTYTLNVRVQDTTGLFATRTVTINVNDLNEAPTALNISNAAINENSANGTVIGTLSSVDQDLPGDTFTYTIQNDPDNKFAIVGNQLRVNGALDFEGATSHSVTIRTNDGNGGTFDQIFTINVGNLNEAPTLLLNTGANVEEGRSVIVRNTMLNGADQDDAAGQITYSASNFVNGHITVNGVVQTSFTQADIDNNLVRFVHDSSQTLAASFDFTLADGGEDGAAATSGTFNLTVAPDDDPIISDTMFEVAENSPAGTVVGQIAFSDTEDLTGDLALSILSGNEDGFFTLAADGTITVANGARLNFEANRIYTLTVQVTDTIGQNAQAVITINLKDVAESDGNDVRPAPVDPAPPSLSDLTPGGFAGNGAGGEILRDALQDRADNTSEIIRGGLFGGLNFGKLDEIIRRSVLGEGNILRQAILGDVGAEDQSVISDIIEEAQAEFEELPENNPPADVMEFLNMIAGVQPSVKPDVQAQEEVVSPERAPTLQEATEAAAQGFMRNVEAFLESL